MINYEWVIRQLDREPSTGGIKTIHWRYRAREDSFVSETFGEVKVTPNPDSPNFILFENVTEQLVISWLESELADKLPEIQEQLIKELELQKTPAVVNGLPWA
jgi:hypothetical protein